MEVNKGEDWSALFNEDEGVDFGDEDGWTLLALLVLYVS